MRDELLCEKQLLIAEVATKKVSRWVSRNMRFTPKEQELLTTWSRAILAGGEG